MTRQPMLDQNAPQDVQAVGAAGGERRPPEASRKRLHDLLLVSLGQGAAAVGAIVGVRIVTHAFPPASYGESALLMTMAALALQLVLLPVGGGVLRFFASAQQQRQVGSFIRAVVRIFAWTSGVIVIVALVAGCTLWGVGQSRWIPALAGVVGFTLASGLSTALDGIQGAAQQRAVVAFHQGAVQWLRPLLAIALIPLMGRSGTVILLGWSAASLVVLLSQLMFLRRLLRADSSFSVPRRIHEVDRWSSTILSYSAPFIMWALFTWAQAASDRWALDAFRSRTEVGLYTAMFQLGYAPMTLLSTIAFQFVSPIVFARAGDGSDRARVAQSDRLNELLPLYFLWGTFCLAALAFLVHGPVCALFLGAEYRSASGLLPWMVLAGGIYAASQLATLGILSSVQTSRLIAPKVVTALMGVVFVVVGAKFLGLAGVIGGLICFSCSCFVWNFALLKQFRGDRQRV